MYLKSNYLVSSIQSTSIKFQISWNLSRDGLTIHHHSCSKQSSCNYMVGGYSVEGGTALLSCHSAPSPTIVGSMGTRDTWSFARDPSMQRSKGTSLSLKSSTLR